MPARANNGTTTLLAAALVLSLSPPLTLLLLQAAEEEERLTPPSGRELSLLSRASTVTPDPHHVGVHTVVVYSTVRTGTGFTHYYLHIFPNTLYCKIATIVLLYRPLDVVPYVASMVVVLYGSLWLSL